MKKNLIFVLLLMVGACGKADTTQNLQGPAFIDSAKSNPVNKRSNHENTLIVGSPELSGNFLPVYYTTAYDAQVTLLIFDGLLKTDEKGVFVPRVAAALPVITENGTVYTVKLKPGIKFHSGKELTADDVVFTYTLLADPSYDGRFTSFVQDMVGYDEYSTGKIKTFAGVKKIDNLTIQFRFTEPLFSNIATLGAGLLNSEFYAFPQGDITPLKKKMTELDGVGPYKLKKYLPKQSIELIRNEQYWDGTPNIENIIIKMVSSITDVQELVSGTIDLLPNIIEPEKLMTANKTGFIERNQYLRHGYGYLMLNSSAEPTSDKRVRQALIYGLNRAAINQIYFKELATLVHAPVSKAFWTYNDELEQKMVVYDYNPEKAAELLDEAGWILQDGKRMKDGKAFVLDWTATKDLPFVDIMSPIVIDNYNKLGIEVRIQQIDFTSLIEKVYNEREGFHMFNMALSESKVPAPFNVWHSRLNVKGGNNTGQFVNAKVDNILDRMKRALDPEDFKALWQEFILLTNDEVPLIPLYTNIYTDLYNRRLKNLNTSSLYTWYDAILEAELVVDDN